MPDITSSPGPQPVAPAASASAPTPAAAQVQTSKRSFLQELIGLASAFGAVAATGPATAAALPGSHHLVIDNGFHSDFFIEYENTVVDAIEAMRWEGLP